MSLGLTAGFADMLCCFETRQAICEAPRFDAEGGFGFTL